MNIRHIILTLLFAHASFIHSTQSFPQCQNSDLEQKLSELTAKMASQEKLLTELLTIMQYREAIATQEKLEQTTKKQAAQARLKLEEQQMEEFTAWFNTLPGWKKHSLQALATVQPFVTDQLWPHIKAILIQLLAQKIVYAGLDSADFITGTLPEKAGVPLLAFRFGEGLTLNKMERENNANIRRAQKDPEYRKLAKLHETYTRETFIGKHKMKLANSIEEASILTEKLNDEKQATQDQLTKLAQAYPNETSQQLQNRLAQEQAQKEKDSIKAKLQHEKNRAELERLKTQAEFQKTQEELNGLRQRNKQSTTNPGRID